MKRLLPLLIFAVIAGTIIYQRNPGVKASVDNAVNKYGGWTEEARKADPKGYIEHAIEKLQSDKAAFEGQRTEYAKIRSETENSLVEAEAKVAKANEIASGAKAAYQAAMGADNWPVTFSGATYTKDQLVQQVSTVLYEKNAHANAIETYKQVMSDVETQNAALLERLAQIDGKIIELKASAQAAEMKKLTAEADAMLAKVNELIEDNSSTLTDLQNGSPIRSIDDINVIEEQLEEKKAQTVANQEVLDFLNGN